jgi:hypothetical protein
MTRVKKKTISRSQRNIRINIASSTETKGYYMKLGRLVYINASINVTKYVIPGRSIYGGASDPDSNCGYIET